MKKIIISILVLFLSAVIVFAATPKKKEKPSDYNLGIKYEQALKSDMPSILLFYTDWCTYCRRFMPTYEALGNKYKDKYNLVMVNGEKNNFLSSVYHIGGFPTVYIIDPQNNIKIHLDNTLYSSQYLIQQELDSYLNLRAKIK